MEKVSQKVLLTGATGLIGKYAIKPLLDAGFEVHAVSSTKQNLQGVSWVKANLLDFNSIKKVFEEIKPDYLLHFAWDTTPGVYIESNANFDWVQSSMEMLKQFHANGGKRTVFAGTCFEYKFQDEPLLEDGELNPTSTYAKCKNLLRQLAELYCEKNDISFGWGRIFYVYGENENVKRLVPHVINSLKNDNEVNISVGELVKDYMFAEDIASAFAAFLNTEIQGCVNICTNTPVKVKDIALKIAQAMNKERLVKIENKPSNEAKIILGNNTRLTKEVGFTPKYTLEQGLDKVIQSML